MQNKKTKKLPGTYYSTKYTKEQIRSKYGKHIVSACMQLEIEENNEANKDFLQNYKDYRKKHRKWIPYYYRGLIRYVVGLSDTVCLHVVLLDDNRMRDWGHILCARRVGEDSFEILTIDCKYSLSCDIKGSFAYLVVNEKGNFVFDDYENVTAEEYKDEILQAIKHNKKINMIKAAWIAYILISWVLAFFLIFVAHDMKYGAFIDIIICAVYVGLLYLAKIVMKKRLKSSDYLYIRKDGLQLLTAFMVIVAGLVMLIN